MKWMTLLTCIALVGAAAVLPATAQEEPDERREKPERDAPGHDRRDAVKERQAEFREAREACKEARGNQTDNATHDGIGQCVSEAAKAKHDPASKARRAYHHITKQIDAAEHRIAKLEMKEYRVEAALEQGNLSANETAELEQKLERIESVQGDLVEKLANLYEKLQQLKDRWANHQDSDRAYPESDDADDADDEQVEEEESASDEAS